MYAAGNSIGCEREKEAWASWRIVFVLVKRQKGAKQRGMGREWKSFLIFARWLLFYAFNWKQCRFFPSFDYKLVDATLLEFSRLVLETNLFIFLFLTTIKDLSAKGENKSESETQNAKEAVVAERWASGFPFSSLTWSLIMVFWFDEALTRFQSGFLYHW